jgi:hypothetical protein
VNEKLLLSPYAQPSKVLVEGCGIHSMRYGRLAVLLCRVRSLAATDRELLVNTFPDALACCTPLPINATSSQSPSSPRPPPPPSASPGFQIPAGKVPGWLQWLGEIGIGLPLLQSSNGQSSIKFKVCSWSLNWGRVLLQNVSIMPVGSVQQVVETGE